MVTARDRFLAAFNNLAPDRVAKYAELTPRQMNVLRERTGSTDPAEHFGYEMREVCLHPPREQTDFSAYLGELPPGSTLGPFSPNFLPPNASWLDQIEIWFSILQRKLLQPNHFVSVAALEQAISEFIERYNQTAKPIKWTYTVEKLEQKLGTLL